MIRSLNLRGLKTSWVEAGDRNRPILLFLHGYPDTPDTWDHQLEEFQNRFHILCPYIRGVHPSEASSNVSRYGHDAVSLDLLQILREVDPSRQKKVVCVGHDLGAVHAWNLAPLLAHRLTGLVILNGLTALQMAKRFRKPKQQLKSWYIYMMQVPGLPETMLRKFPRTLSSIGYQLGGLELAERPTFPGIEATFVYSLNQYRAFVRDIPKLLKRRVKKVSCPVLVLWGEHDRFLMTPTEQEFNSYAKDVTIRILPGNHWIHRERKEQVNRLLNDFFKTLEFPHAAALPSSI